MIRVLLADDHEIVRLGLRSVLEGAEDIDVVGEVATAEAAVSAAQAGGIDVILMDLRFGAGVEGTRVMGGAEATAQIRSAMATPPKPPRAAAIPAAALPADAAGDRSAAGAEPLRAAPAHVGVAVERHTLTVPPVTARP